MAVIVTSAFVKPDIIGQPLCLNLENRNMLRPERLIKISRWLRDKRSVSFEDMRRELEVSRPTLYRDLAYLRDRMGVPLFWDETRQGYRLDASAGVHEVPGLWLSAEEILALLTMHQLLSELDPAGFLGRQLAPIRQRLLALLEGMAYPLSEISSRIRILSVASRSGAGVHFQALITAVLERRRLRIAYKARSNGRLSSREISPQRLVRYRENWYLDAWCHLRDEIRSFAVDAIESVEAWPEAATAVPDDVLDRELGAGYGIFSGAQVRWATLRFTPERARWVAAERWHPEQEGGFLGDGSYQLRLPYSNDPELIMDILKYGPDCEVEGPRELRERVLGLLAAAVRRYEQ